MKELQVGAAKVGLDWPRVAEVLVKLCEEVREFKAEIRATPSNWVAVAVELSDVLFTVVNVARWLELDVETVLAQGNMKFSPSIPIRREEGAGFRC